MKKSKDPEIVFACKSHQPCGYLVKTLTVTRRTNNFVTAGRHRFNLKFGKEAGLPPGWSNPWYLISEEDYKIMVAEGATELHS